ncbi:hypothetical protein [Phenylobacterium sp. 58.2.17]|uniref:hypothetical protein n=1 Tax=Phenylobacterium sp. 58.2.17 TaxID=2969306 RepID=UPI002264FA5A|nr:hypothetical protein [Phenylobacterium sp. 58.2.17]MCX7586129.1 hypothetical protein [Phenylobacterium sp. 58.2.17]
MDLKVFYSWQSDRENRLCRGFIAKALDDAVKRLATRRGLKVTIDSDTKGVVGTPPVSDTILRKIRDCDVFLADMTFVAETAAGKRTPNPNVLVEYGYALHDKGAERILLTMNIEFGPADLLPFDLRHLRHPIAYAASDALADDARREARAALSRTLELALEAMADDIGGTARPSERQLQEALRTLVVDTQNARIASDPPVLVSRPQAVLYLAPATALDRPRLDLARVSAASRMLVPNDDGWGVGGQDQRQWWAHGPPREVAGNLNREATWSARLLRPGVVEQILMVAERIDDDQDIAVEGLRLETELIGRIDRSLALLAAIGLAGPTLVALAMYDVQNVQLLADLATRRFRTPNLGLGDVLLPEGTTRSGDLVRSLLDDLWLAAGRADGSPFYDGDGRWVGYAPAGGVTSKRG